MKSKILTILITALAMIGCEKKVEQRTSEKLESTAHPSQPQVPPVQAQVPSAAHQLLTLPKNIEYDLSRFSYNVGKRKIIQHRDSGKFEVDDEAVIHDSKSNKDVLSLTLIAEEGRAVLARVHVVHDRWNGGYVLDVADLCPDDLRETNELRSIIAKAKQWAATARTENMTTLDKDLWTKKAGRYPERVVRFRIKNGEHEFSLPSFEGGLQQEAWLNENEWDAILYLSENLNDVLKPFQSYATNELAAQRNKEDADAAEKRRKDALFK